MSSNSNMVHTKNIQLLVIEIFKSLHHLNSFVLKPEVYNLRQGPSLIIPRAQSICVINIR